MPRAKKAHGRQDNRKGRSGSLTVVVPDASVPTLVPKATTRWLKPTKDAWSSFWESELGKTAATRPEMRHSIQRLFEMYDDQERAWRVYRKEPMVSGSMGQVVTNPMFSVAMNLENQIRNLEDRSGLSLKSAIGLGLLNSKAQMTAEVMNRMMEEADDGGNKDPIEEEVLEGFAVEKKG